MIHKRKKTRGQEAEFERLAREVADAEASLREHFERTPGPDAQTLQAVKALLRREVQAAGLTKRNKRARLAWLSAAAAVLLAAVGLQTFRLAGRPSSESPAPAVSEAEFETFTVSLAAVLEQEDPDLAELQREIAGLEIYAYEDFPEPAQTQPAQGTGQAMPPGPGDRLNVAAAAHALASRSNGPCVRDDHTPMGEIIGAS